MSRMSEGIQNDNHAYRDFFFKYLKGPRDMYNESCLFYVING